MRILLSYILPEGKIFQYYDSAVEIFECDAAFIIMIVALFFYNKRKIVSAGKDIKQVISG